MSNVLKFEFDFDEVFEGIKQGVIGRLEEMKFNIEKDKTINKIKNEIEYKLSIKYDEECELRNEIKDSLKKEVFDRLINEVNGKYLERFDKYMEEQLSKNPNRLEELKGEIKKKLVQELYDDLYDSIRNEVVGEVKDTVGQLCNLIGGNAFNIAGTNRTISNEEYEELLDRDKVLTALEAGGVDNWEGYEISLEELYHNDEE